jgi:hypothetical protein
MGTGVLAQPSFQKQLHASPTTIPHPELVRENPALWPAEDLVVALE